MNCAILVTAPWRVARGDRWLALEIKDQLICPTTLIALTSEILAKEIAFICGIQITMVAEVSLIYEGDAVREQGAP
jgi:hypothetical protein